MERLLVAVENTDGFTFSVTEHVPVVFSSKEEFLITLEDKIKEAQANIKQHQKIYDAESEKIEKKLQKNRQAKNLGEKDREKLNSEILEMMGKNRELEEQITQMHNFTLGGYNFAISDFVSRSSDYEDKTEYLNLPNVYTLDEFFAEVEQNLAPNKPKM